MSENVYLTKTSEIRKFLYDSGYPEGLPNPCRGIGKCGVSTLLYESENHFVLVFRFCNCDEKPDRFYEALLLSKESNSYGDAVQAFIEIANRNNISLDTCLEIDPAKPVNN
jgi:hypothetical protein